MAAENHRSSSSFSYNYEVFLSFRGVDTRRNFTGHLYTALVGAGIRTFMDNEELRHGEEIGTELFQAIEESRISIPILSENYASSKWCLKELAKIMECKETDDQIVFPIFYKVDPTHVRNQTGIFAEAFLKYEKEQPNETVDCWRKALREAGNLKGWDTETPENSYEAELIKLVVQKILSNLNKTTPLDVAKFPVGIDSHVEEVLRLIDVTSKDVQFVGIHGMAGIGKTTIAKAVYNTIFPRFVGGCFLADVRKTASQSEGLVQLQNILLSDIMKGIDQGIRTCAKGITLIKQRCNNMNVLIVLDDVDHDKQLESLAGKHNWFGSGSVIIITTRDGHILNFDDKTKIYQPKELDDNQSLRLFSNHAFGTDQPPHEYLELSKMVVSKVGGLPLALEVLGSFLRDKRRPRLWEDALKSLNKIPNDDIQKILQISYDGLSDFEQKIFLDIACFLIGIFVEDAINILEEYSPRIGIEVLVLKSLLKIDGDKLRMHDLLQDMGREIVRQENPRDPGMRSRLWSHEEALKVLKKGKGTSNVEGLRLDFSGYAWKDRSLSLEAFEQMPELRLLQVDYADLDGDFRHLPEGLKLLSLKGLPLKCIPTISHLDKLTALDMSRSMITEDWNGWQQIQLIETLKVLDLSSCDSLTRTPDFSRYTSLERLILDSCMGLVQCHESIGHLEKLDYLSLNHCQNLEGLPGDVGRLTSLKVLNLVDNRFCSLPGSFSCLSALEVLNLNNCTGIQSLPELPSSLIRLEVTGCVTLERLPNMSNLKNLNCIYNTDCKSLVMIEGINFLTRLKDLYLFKLVNLQSVPELPSSLHKLFVRECHSLERLPDLSNLKNLRQLFIILCENISEIPDISELSLLWEFCLQYCGKVQSLPKLPSSLTTLAVELCGLIERLDLSNLKNLERLDIFYFDNLAEVRGLEMLESLNCLTVLECHTYVKTLQKRVAQGMFLNAFDRKEIREPFLIPGDDNIKGTALFFIYELSEPVSSSPMDEYVFDIVANIRRKDGKVIRCRHSIGIVDMEKPPNMDQFYWCYFQGLTWFDLRLKKGDVIEVIGFVFEPKEREAEIKMLDFVMEYEVVEESQQIENRLGHIITSICDDTEEVGRARQPRREHDEACPTNWLGRLVFERIDTIC